MPVTTATPAILTKRCRRDALPNCSVVFVCSSSVLNIVPTSNACLDQRGRQTRLVLATGSSSTGFASSVVLRRTLYGYDFRSISLDCGRRSPCCRARDLVLEIVTNLVKNVSSNERGSLHAIVCCKILTLKGGFPDDRKQLPNCRVLRIRGGSGTA